MTAEKFWMGWLKIIIGIIILAGIFLVILGNSQHAEILNQKINQVFFSGSIPDEASLLMKGWLIAVSGSIMVGWGSSMLYIVLYPFKRGESWSWRSIFYPLIIWYLIDSSISVYYGVAFNVIINTILFLQIMAPLLFLRNRFFHKPKTA